MLYLNAAAGPAVSESKGNAAAEQAPLTIKTAHQQVKSQ